MRPGPRRPHAPWGLIPLAALAALGSPGCIASARNAIPAHCLLPGMAGASRDRTCPVDYALLRQDPPPAHVIGPGDVLGVHVKDVVGADEPAAVFFPPPFGNATGGNPNPPAVGSPIRVGDDGRVDLPLLPPTAVAGMTLLEATGAIRRAYSVDRKVLQPDQARVTVTLIRPRTYHVLVVREDNPVGNGPATKAREEAVLSKRGSAHVLDLPAYQNDVLHALSLTGGLPGVDARNEVVVLRGAGRDWGRIAGGGGAAADPVELVGRSRATVIPLRLPPAAPPPFGPRDVLLGDGDVVFVGSRESEHFFTGGLLQGGQFPLPRDYDLDVLGAVAISGGSPAGPAATVGGPYGVFPPTRVVVLRTLPGGSQVKILVDLRKAFDDPRERLAVRPRDVVILQYTPFEVAANYALSIFGIRYNYSTISQSGRSPASLLPMNN